jgi:hypothetical protein
MYLLIYSNGNIYISNEVNFFPGQTNTGSSSPKTTEAGALVATVKFNPNMASQKVTTLGGTVSSSLTATGNVTRGGQSKELT